MANKILIALDSSEGAWSAVEYVANTFGETPGVQVTLIHILPGLPPGFWDHGHIISSTEEKESLQRLEANWEEKQEEQWHSLMTKARDRLKQAGIPQDVVTYKFKPKYYDVAEDILDEAETEGFDNIVMGRRGLGRARALLLGSVTNKVAQKAKGFAVTIVSNLRPIQKILFPIDLDADGKRVIPVVQDLASKYNAAIFLFYVVQPVTSFPSFYVNLDVASIEAEALLLAKNQMAALAEEFFSDFPKLETRVEFGDPAEKILEVVEHEEIDMIIMGTHGRKGIERAILGSVAFEVVQSAPCTVVTIHP
jgi:nucleotide-binding universal stress UspA family protein